MSQFVISIADVSCLITCSDEGLCTFFRDTFAPFLSDAKESEFTFVFSRDTTRVELRTCSVKHFHAKLTIDDVTNTQSLLVFHYLFKVAFARMYVAKHYGLLLHASSAVNNSNAVVIAGDKGVGKSTSLHALQEKGYVGLSDDVAILRMIGDSICIYASPFQERHEFFKKRQSVLCKRLFFLHRTFEQNSIRELSVIERVNAIYYHAYAWGFGTYTDESTMKALRELAYKIALYIRCFDVHLCTIDSNTVATYFLADIGMV